jgi:hypothetical protein
MGVVFGGLKLHKAINRGDNARLQELLEQGVDPNSTCDSPIAIYREYPLQRVVEANNLKAVELLLEKGATTEAYGWGSTLFSYAVRCGYFEIADLLLEKKPEFLNERGGSGGYTPLAKASEEGRIETIKYLLKKGADTTIKTYDNRTAYFLAQKEGRQDVVDMLAPYYVSPVEKAPVVKSTQDEWKKLADDRIAHVVFEESINYKITDIFNFSARERTKICVNMETAHESAETIGFDMMQDKALLEQAFAELHKQGGTADPGSVTGMYKTPHL